MLASPESALSCPPLSLSRGRSLSHPSLFFPWELRLSALNQPLEDSVKPRGWPLTINLGPYVTPTRQKGVFQRTQGGKAGRGSLRGASSKGSSVPGLCDLPSQRLLLERLLPPLGWVSPLTARRISPRQHLCPPRGLAPQACGGWFPVGCGPLPTKETGKETWRGRAGVHGVHSFILMNILSVCGISESPVTH